MELLKQQGYCKEIIRVTGTVKLIVDKQNKAVVDLFTLHNEYPKRKSKIGDLIVLDDHRNCLLRFDKNLLPKFHCTHKNKFRLSKDKSKISTQYLYPRKLIFSIIHDELHIQMLSFFDSDNQTEIKAGKVVVFIDETEIECYSVEQFLHKYRIVK